MKKKPYNEFVGADFTPLHVKPTGSKAQGHLLWGDGVRSRAHAYKLHRVPESGERRFRDRSIRRTCRLAVLGLLPGSRSTSQPAADARRSHPLTQPLFTIHHIVARDRQRRSA